MKKVMEGELLEKERNNEIHVVVIQPTVPKYRVDFFQKLADIYGKYFFVYASDQKMGILTQNDLAFEWKNQIGPIRTILPGLKWQHGVMSISMSRGDVFVISGDPRYLTNIALVIKAKLVGVTVVWWGHYRSSTTRNWRKSVRLSIAKLADAMLFYTDNEVQEYKREENKDRKDPVFALNNGINTERIISLRDPYNVLKRERRMLYIGRITSKANLPILLKTLSRPECSDLYLDVIGDGSEKLINQELAVSLNVEGNVNWHGASIDESFIAEVANKCILFVYPGNVGLSLLHGLSYGLPAIIHNDRLAHNPEADALIDGVNGLLFSKNDPSSLAEVIMQALEAPDLLKGMSDEAIATTTKSYNVNDMVARFVSVMKELGVKT